MSWPKDRMSLAYDIRKRRREPGTEYSIAAASQIGEANWNLDKIISLCNLRHRRADRHWAKSELCRNSVTAVVEHGSGPWRNSPKVALEPGRRRPPRV
jgi:hypothetical protein